MQSRVNDASSAIYMTYLSFVLLDLLALVVIWTKSFKNWMEMRRLKQKPKVSHLLLRDGANTFYLPIHRYLTLVTRYDVLHVGLFHHFWEPIFTFQHYRALLAMNIAEIAFSSMSKYWNLVQRVT